MPNELCLHTEGPWKQRYRLPVTSIMELAPRCRAGSLRDDQRIDHQERIMRFAYEVLDV